MIPSGRVMVGSWAAPTGGFSSCLKKIAVASVAVKRKVAGLNHPQAPLRRDDYQIR